MNQAQISYELAVGEWLGVGAGTRAYSELCEQTELESALTRIKSIPGVQNIMVSVKENGKWVRSNERE